MKQGLTKNDSFAIKGLAIILMLFHHLYCTADRFNGFEIDFTPFSQTFVVNVAFLFKVCVSLFAFITGYGLLKSIAGQNFNRKDIVKWNTTRLIKTLSGFWFIYVIFLIVTMLINKLPYTTYFEKTPYAGIFYLINDFLGLANLFNTPTLNGTWWYMSAAIVFILIIPLVYALSKKTGYLPIILLITILPRLLKANYPGGTNIYTFILPVVFGMMFADYDLFNKIEERLPKNKIVSYITSFVLFGGLIGAGYIIMLKYDRTVAWELNYGIIPLAFICFFRFCIIRIPVLNKILEFLGKHSMTIFLTHTFIRLNYLRNFVYSFKHFMLIFAVLFVLSLALALALDFIKSFADMMFLLTKSRPKFKTLKISYPPAETILQGDFFIVLLYFR